MRLPIFQHPSLTVLVADSEAFLARLQRELGEPAGVRTFSDPHAALESMRRKTRIGSHSAPAVVVVDQKTAGMTGVDFCAALAGHPCKKILLTAAGDERATIDAFNRGVIDRAIRKSDGDALDQLASAIAALRREYFLELSDAIAPPHALGEYSFLRDPAVAQLVRDISAKHGVVEHYLHAAPSGLMLIDAAGGARLMAIETDSGMQSHHEVARDSGAPPSLLDAIDARCIVPWFRTGESMYDASVGERWYRFCEPARVCEGAQRYHWALFDTEAD